MRKIVERSIFVKMLSHICLVATLCGVAQAQSSRSPRLSDEGKKEDLRAKDKALTKITGDATPIPLADHRTVSAIAPYLELRPAIKKGSRDAPYIDGLIVKPSSLMTNEVIFKRAPGLSDHRREPSVISTQGFQGLPFKVKELMGTVAVANACRRAQIQLSDFGLEGSKFSDPSGRFGLIGAGIGAASGYIAGGWPGALAGG